MRQLFLNKSYLGNIDEPSSHLKVNEEAEMIDDCILSI